MVIRADSAGGTHQLLNWLVGGVHPARHHRRRLREGSRSDWQISYDPDGHRLTAFATNTTPAGPAANSLTSNCGTAAAPAPG